jgi:hypothetical protein
MPTSALLRFTCRVAAVVRVRRPLAPPGGHPVSAAVCERSAPRTTRPVLPARRMITGRLGLRARANRSAWPSGC